MWQIFVVLALLLAGPLGGSASAADVADATGRHVAVPDTIARVMPAGPPASVLLYVLAPEKMVGWTVAPGAAAKEFLAPPARDLPGIGRLTGRGDTANIEVVLSAKPDLILDFGTVSPTFVSLAERVQQQTNVPYLLFDGRLENTAASIRKIGAVLGVSPRAEMIARYVEETERMLDARLKDIPEAARHRIYLARQQNGLETGLTGSINTEIIERAGGVNVALRGAGRAGLANVSIEQVIAWAPDTIVTVNPGFYDAIGKSAEWAQVPAVTTHRVYLAPRLPFGWIDDPPSVNRALGMRWMAGLLYPDKFPEDIHAEARNFFKLFYQVEPDAAALDRLLAGARPAAAGR
jgi:iron complex transport system substrate-binding protein